MGERLGSFFGLIAGLVMFAAFLLVFILANGGYVYRTECPRAGGSTETAWTYQIWSFIPYVGYSRSGCETHTGTRVALDAIGVWKLDEEGSAQEPTASHQDEYTASDVAKLRENCIAGGSGDGFCRCMVGELTIRFSKEDAQRLAVALSTGAGRYDELPPDLQDEAVRFGSAVERDC